MDKNANHTSIAEAKKPVMWWAGYPPDMQMQATETVLKQAEMIANELAK